MKPRSAHRWVPLVAAGLLLSGCGLSDPGTAATVGDQEISVAEVQRLTEGACAITGLRVATGQAQALPLAVQKQTVVQLLGQGAAAEQYAASQGIEVPGTVVQFLRSQVRQDLEQIESTSEREAAADFYDSFIGGLTAGAAVAAEEAGKQLSPDNLDQFLGQSREEVLPRLAADADVSVDPRYGLDDDLAASGGSDGSVSEPVSDLAVQLSGGDDTGASAAGLPPAQRCGG